MNTTPRPGVPRITVGLPVYHGERYLAAALDSILEQTVGDFELIIADNASTDATPGIAQRYAEQDGRVRVIRHETNIGAAPNHNLLVHEARGAFFKWAAHDDVLHPRFLEACLAALEARPDAVAAFPRTIVIDAGGNELGRLATDMTGSDHGQAVVRLRTVLRTDVWCVDLFGLFRTEALRRTSLIPSYIGSDRVLRAELALQGPLVEIPEALFYSRDHPGRSTRAMPSHHQRGAWYNPSLESRRVLPHWRIFGEYLAAVRRATLPRGERRVCQAAVFGWLLHRANGMRMLADLIIAIFPGTWKWFYRYTRSGERWLPIGPGTGKEGP